MEMNWKKHLLIAGVACSSLVSSAFAAEGCPPPPPPKPVCDVPCDTPPAGQIGEYREITPNAGPRVCDGADVFLTGTFIWWNARQEGLAFIGSNMTNDTVSPIPNASRGSTEHAFQDWAPGFKVGLGVNLPHDGWDIYAEYTWLRPSDRDSRSRSFDASASERLFPYWDIGRNFTTYGPSTVDPITSARGRWKHRVNVIDVELGRNFFTSQYLSLRPFWGLKGTWQNQTYRVRYEQTDNATGNQIDAYRMRNNQDYWGVGLRTGMDSTWHFNDSFSLYGDFAISALWSRFEVDRRDTEELDIEDAASFETTLFNTRNTYSMGKAVLEMEIGFRWETWFSNDDYHFMIQAGWEHQIWFSHNNLIHWFEESAHGDLTFMGLDIKLRFDF